MQSVDVETGEVLALAAAEQQQLERCEGVITSGLKQFIEVGDALLQIRDGRLYRVDYHTFEDYCRERWSMSRPRAYQLMEAAGVAVTLSTNGKHFPQNERQARELAKFDADLHPAIMRTVEAAAKTLNKPMTTGMIQRVGEVITQAANTGVVDVHGESTPLDAAIVEAEAEAIKRQKQYIHDNGEKQRETLANLHSSESNEWYTPPLYVLSARRVLGAIDLDPASSEVANRTVRALRYFTQADDGLTQAWRGNVWLNPPYGTDDKRVSNQARWAHKLIAEYAAGNVTAAVLLVSANTSEKWFQALWDYPICFTDHRINFIPGAGQKSSGSNHGSALVYFGANVDRFAVEFRQHGRIVIPDNEYSKVLA